MRIPLRPIVVDAEALKGVDVLAEIDIPEGTETECMNTCVGRYSWYAVLYAKFKSYREYLEAQLYKQYRQEYAKVKTTEPMLEALIRSDEKWAKARKLELQFEGLAEAFKMRVGIIQSLGAMMRSEKEGVVRTLQTKVVSALNQSRKG